MTRNASVFMLLIVLLLAACGETTVQEEIPPTATTMPTAQPTAQSTATPIPEPTAEVVAEPTAEIVAEPTAAAAEEEPVSTNDDEVGRRFTIVPESSQASYSVGEEFFANAVERLGVELGTTVTVGSTNEVEGSFTLDFAQPFPLLENHFVVNIQSLTSDQPRRDERLREQGLNSNRFPLAEFVANGVEGFPENYSEGEEITFDLVGEMTIREVTNPMVFTVTAVLSNSQLAGTAVGTMLMTDYGFEPPSIGDFFTVEDEVLLTVEFVAAEE
ncbi:MAG: YceI family protein [Chloroflexota bacterium]